LCFTAVRFLRICFRFITNRRDAIHRVFLPRAEARALVISSIRLFNPLFTFLENKTLFELMEQSCFVHNTAISPARHSTPGISPGGVQFHRPGVEL
jgi:hypothetical protein